MPLGRRLGGVEYLSHPYTGKYNDAAANQSISNDSLTSLTDTFLDGTDNGGLGLSWNSTTELFTINEDGLYLIQLGADFATAASGVGLVRASRTGSIAAPTSGHVPFANAALNITHHFTDVFLAGETVGPLRVYQKTGGAINLTYAELYVYRLL